MTAEEQTQSLDALAGALGITRTYHDGTGRHRRACDEAVLAVVRALGAPVNHLQDCAQALREVQQQQHAGDRQSPTSCVREREGGFLRLPRSTAGVCPGVRLLMESGEAVALRIAERGSAGVFARIPRSVPAGVHRIVVDAAKGPQTTTLFVAPPRLPEAPRGWGLFAPLYALRGAGDDAQRMATYGDLATLARWMTGGTARSRRHRDAAFLGTLPLLACYFEEPFEPSPYSPVSRAFWSELYVDPSAAPEFVSSPEAARVLAEQSCGALRECSHIDYRAAMRERRAGIEALRRTLDATPGRRRDAFERSLDEDHTLADYAAFRAAVERHGSTWESWPDRARGGTLRAGVDYDGEVFRYHAFAQWLAREQFADAAARSPAGFYLDLPLGCHGGGYDTWKHASDHAFGVSIGAPPDDVFDGGQNWGFPPLHPLRAAAAGFPVLRAALRHHFEHAAMLRIDHVMGLHRSFWIPDGFTAADGVYVHSPAEELWNLLAIEAARGRSGRGSAVVGEDLGTVAPQVRDEMTARGALRMFVLPFEHRRLDDPPLVQPPRDSLACLGTHDMEPFATWWSSADCPRARLAEFLGCSDEEKSALEALLEWTAAGDATIALVSLEDLWLERKRQNLPGTSAGDTNWQQPFAQRFEQFSVDQKLCRLLDIVRGAATREEAPR